MQKKKKKKSRDFPLKGSRERPLQGSIYDFELVGKVYKVLSAWGGISLNTKLRELSQVMFSLSPSSQKTFLASILDSESETTT